MGIHWVYMGEAFGHSKNVWACATSVARTKESLAGKSQHLVRKTKTKFKIKPLGSEASRKAKYKHWVRLIFSHSRTTWINTPLRRTEVPTTPTRRVKMAPDSAFDPALFGHELS
jgi:hypothetical protein